MARVNFAWNANPEPDVNNYRMYAGRQSGVYTAPTKDMGNVTGGFYDVEQPGTWFFALTALNTSALESGFSGEVSATLSLGPGLPGPFHHGRSRSTWRR